MTAEDLRIEEENDLKRKQMLRGKDCEEERAEAGPMRTVYLSILLSHIALAAVSLPFILLSFVYGFTNQTAKHRRIATRVFPVWLYVAVTGPVVYLMLRPYY